MEKDLLACALHSRQDYELVVSHIKPKSASYSKEFQVLLEKVGDYYGRDADAQSVSTEVLLAQVVESIRNDKLSTRLVEYVEQATAGTASLANVKAVILLAKQQEVADRLSAALVTNLADPKVKELMQELSDLQQRDSLEDDNDEDVLIQLDLANLMATEYDPTNVIRIYPDALNRRLDAGAKKAHHIIVFARPNAGKTAFAVNLGSGAARQGKRVAHFINEDRGQDVYIRYVCNLSGRDKHWVRDNPHEAAQLARANGMDNVIVINIKPGTPDQIRYYIKKYNIDVAIVDQLRNLQVKADSRVNQLESAATSMRNIGKELNVLMVSFTQAGDSARDKLILDDGDIDFSNTGIPAQADLLIGIGMDAEYDQQGLRMLTLIKNKIGGIEEHFPVRIIKALSRYTSV